MVVVDRRGGARLLAPDSGAFDSPRISPDGRRIALERDATGRLLASGRSPDIWVYDVASGVMSRLTSGARSARPEWSRDGQRIAYVRQDSNLVEWQAWDRSGVPEVMLAPAQIYQVSLGPRPGYVVVRTGGRRRGQRDLAIAHWDSLRALRPLIATEAQENEPSLSPDGTLLAYVSDETGRNEVYVRPVPGPGARVQVSTNGGDEPVWSRAGRELFYRTGTHLLSASLMSRPALALVRRDTLFQDQFASPGTLHAHYDVFPNGKEFVMLKALTAGDSPAARLIVLMSWTQELKRRAPPR
jgi:serine/threonine-protein kinase